MLAIVNILFYLLYFVLLYLAFTYQDQSQRREGGSDGEVSDSVMIVETSISALFATGYCLLAIAFGLLGIPFFCRLDGDSDAGYLEIGDAAAHIGDTTPSQKKKKNRKSSSTSLNNSENDIGEAAAGRRGGRTSRGVPRNASESSFIDVRFSASDDEGWSHTFDGDLGNNSLAKWRVDEVTDDELEGGHRHVGVDTAEADRFIITKKIPISGPGTGAAAAAVGHLGLQPSAKPLTCMRKSLLVVCLLLIIICFIARVTFLILSLFFETPDQYNLHTDGASGREALKIVTRFLYYLIGEVLPALLLLVLHCHVIVNLRGSSSSLSLSSTATVRETSESSLLLPSSSGGSTRGADTPPFQHINARFLALTPNIRHYVRARSIEYSHEGSDHPAARMRRTGDGRIGRLRIFRRRPQVSSATHWSKNAHSALSKLAPHAEPNGAAWT